MFALLTHRLSFVAGLLLAAVLVLPSSGHSEEFGFKATLDNPPSMVSAYDGRPQDFSVANPPLVFPSLSPILDRKPRVISSSFDGKYLVFGAEYHRGDSLIPVAASAEQFMKYRMAKYERDGFGRMGQRALAAQQGKQGSDGISVGMKLPKRLESVFGEGGGNLRVSGFRRVSFSGRSQWRDGVVAEQAGRSKFPSLNMDQVYRFDIDGTIGSKISVHVSEDSQTDIPLANRLQLRYKGDDDDILKVIEAGNTNLSLPNTRFVGYSSQIRGLFGIKTEAQLGALKLTSIVSQEKGSSERASISSNGDSSATRIRDFDYAEGRIYSLFYSKEGISPNDRVIDMHVYEARPNVRPEEELTGRKTRLVIDPSKPDDPLFRDSIPMWEIDRNLYNFYDDPATNRHYVVFNSEHKYYALGVWIKLEKRSSSGAVLDTVVYGDIGDKNVITLKMLRPSESYVPAHPTWSLMWRNIYRIPQGVKPTDLNIRILKAPVGSEGTSSALEDQRLGGQSQGKYIRILGIDQYDRNGAKRPDDIVDDRLEIFNSEWGLLIFPDSQPFNSDTQYTDVNGQLLPALAEKVPEIYNYTSDKQKTDNSKYYIEYSSRTRSSLIRLNRANIIEGSERVTVNGRTLTRGPDYSIQYDFGTVTLLAPDAMDPNAKVNIDFEYAPFLAVQKKSLFGLRGEYSFSDDFRVGSTMLYKTDKAQDRKPRVGQETARMMVVDFDGTVKFYPRFLTKALNALPFLATDAPSALTVSGEVAQSRPNPNIDNVAYVDDFESALEQLTLPMVRGAWTLASHPLQASAPSTDSARAKMLWHNPVGGVATTEVYDKDVKQGEGIINTFRMIFRPRQRLVNHNTNRAATDTIKTESWAGIMTYFTGIDPYRVQLFEIRARGTRGRLHFDFGKINEDVNGDNQQNTEDGVTDLSLRNNLLEPEEDLGLDGTVNTSEVGYDPTTNPDPDGDNWYSQGKGICSELGGQCNDADFNNPASSKYYDYLNGTEKNGEDLSSGGLPDDEKLSQARFNPVDAYFSYVIDLSNTDSTSKNSFYVSNSTRNGWKTFRIPIRDSSSLDTILAPQSIAPDWGQVTHARVWFEADSSQHVPDTVEIANWYFVQSNWQDSTVTRRLQDDSMQFVVASVSTEDGTFTPPPGVEAYQDKTNNVTEAQKGLGLVYKDILVGDTCMAVKRLPSVDRYSGYGSLEMYVHGDTTHSLSNSDSVMFFLRVGRDSKTFYEYHTMVAPGWSERNFVKMDFNEMTALKDRFLRALPKNSAPDLLDSTIGNYRIKGNPNINEVQYFAAGIVNLDPNKPANGQIWLDELRVTNVRRDVGTAARVEVMGNLADLGSYNIQWGSQNPYFRGISATTRGGSSDNLGSGASSNDYSWSLSLSMDRFLPRSLGAAIPIGYSYSRTSRLPLLRAGTDIVLPEETRLAERALGIAKTFRVSESFQRKGRNPVFNWFLNRQQLSFSYSRNANSDVNRPYSFGENYNVQGQFDMSVQTPPGIKFMGWTRSIPILKRLRNTRLGLYPNSWRWAGTFNRNLTVSDDISFKRTYSFQRDFDGRVDLDYKILDNLNAKFAANTRRDLTDPSRVKLTLKDWRLGQEITFNQSFSLGYDPKLFSFITSAFAYQSSYGDNWDRTTGSLKSDLNRTWNVAGSFKHLELLSFGRKGSGGQSASYDPSQGTVNRRAARTATGKKVDPKKKDNKPFYDPPLAVLRFLTGWIQPVQYRYGEAYTSSLPGMLERPELSYRLGFNKTTNVSLTREIRNPYSTAGRNWELSSGFGLLGGISTQVGYKFAETKDVVRIGNLAKRTSTVFPSLQVTITRFKTLPLLKGPLNKFIDIFAPRTGFDREVAEEYDLTAGFLTSRTESKDFNPLLGVNFKLFKALSLSASYQLNLQKGQRFNNTDGGLITDTRATQRSITVTSRYSFRAPGGLSIPLFGKVKVTSTMNIEVNVRKSLNTSETASGDGPFIRGENKEDMMIQPVISYDFSQQIKGGLTAQWQDTKDGSRKSHTRMLQIWAEIRF